MTHHDNHREADRRAGLRARTQTFLTRQGRRPRILVAVLERGGHAGNHNRMATLYADCGFDVDISPRLAGPEELARSVVENDVHVVIAIVPECGRSTTLRRFFESLGREGGDGTLVMLNKPNEADAWLLFCGDGAPAGNQIALTGVDAIDAVLDVLEKKTGQIL